MASHSDWTSSLHLGWYFSESHSNHLLLPLNVQVNWTQLHSLLHQWSATAQLGGWLALGCGASLLCIVWQAPAGETSQGFFTRVSGLPEKGETMQGL